MKVTRISVSNWFNTANSFVEFELYVEFERRIDSTSRWKVAKAERCEVSFSPNISSEDQDLLAPTVSPIAAPPTVVAALIADCSSELRNLDHCLNFVVSGAVDAPSAECTSEATDSLSCLCSLVNAGSGAFSGLNVVHSLQLSALCHIVFGATICISPLLGFADVPVLGRYLEECSLNGVRPTMLLLTGLRSLKIQNVEMQKALEVETFAKVYVRRGCRIDGSSGQLYDVDRNLKVNVDLKRFLDIMGLLVKLPEDLKGIFYTWVIDVEFLFPVFMEVLCGT
ncbi:hypothetical protein R1sor_020443 [Riccia sorocarpa]|uniref:Bifunctional inhibitor/plant lipid transfer protein/seed storage helical domain-containing protein n=1 Tax=Riccia sorocarpa TaxID=122646 RepID=A0ABD3IGI4_9MARC